MVRYESFLLLPSCDGGKTEVETEPMEMKQTPEKEIDTCQVTQSVKNLPANAGDMGSIPPGEDPLE